MAERQMRDKAPGAALAQRRTPRRRRRSQAGETRDPGRCFGEAKLGATAAEGQQGGKVAVEALRVDRKDPVDRCVRVEIGVARGKVYLAAGERRGGVAADLVKEAATDRRFRIAV